MSLQTGCELWGGELHLAEPSGDEEIPTALPGAHLGPPEHFSLPLTRLDPRLAAQSVRRPGDPLDMGSNKEQRTEKDPEESDLAAGAMGVGTSSGGGAPGHTVRTAPIVDIAMHGYPALDLDNRRLDVSSEDRGNAIDFPNAGWASFARLYNLEIQPRPSPDAAFRTGPLTPMDPNARLDRWLLVKQSRVISLHRR